MPENVDPGNDNHPVQDDTPPPEPKPDVVVTSTEVPDISDLDKWFGSVREWFPALFAGVLLAVSISVSLNTPVSSLKELQVIATLVQVGDHWEIHGRVLLDGAPVKGARTWAVVTYTNGQHDSPAAGQSDEKGAFTLSPVLGSLGLPAANPEKDKNKNASCNCASAIREATVSATIANPGGWFTPSVTLHGEDTVRPSGASTEAAEIVGLSPRFLAPLAAIFLISGMLPFFGKHNRRKYLWAVVMAFAVTATMILYISLGLRFVTSEGKSKQVLDLGFASIYRGTYVDKVQPEWLISLTSKPVEDKNSSQDAGAAGTPAASAGSTPAPDATGSKPADKTADKPAVTASSSPGITKPDAVALDHGFGAPLWVLLVSVLGAGVLTVALLVNEINNMPAEDPKAILNHLQTIVQHQLFILFAPVTAIFVYQSLVAGAAASSSLTVGVAAFGAGPSLSALLTKAGASAANLFATKSP